MDAGLHVVLESSGIYRYEVKEKLSPPPGNECMMALIETVFLAKSTERLMILIIHSNVKFMNYVNDGSP